MAHVLSVTVTGRAVLWNIMPGDSSLWNIPNISIQDTLAFNKAKHLKSRFKNSTGDPAEYLNPSEEENQLWHSPALYHILYPASKTNSTLLPRAGNSHAELPLVAKPLCKYAFYLRLVSKNTHVVLHDCLFLKAVSLPFWDLLFFHWKVEASLGTESPIQTLDKWDASG